jgi:hypothetical protein
MQLRSDTMPVYPYVDIPKLQKIDVVRIKMALKTHIESLMKFKENTGDQAVLDFIDTEIRPFKELLKTFDEIR